MARIQLDTAGVADLLGVDRGTVYRYRSGDRAKYGFPEPDGHLGQSPWWWSTTIERWAAKRPGKGTGAGRPRKTKEEAE